MLKWGKKCSCNLQPRPLLPGGWGTAQCPGDPGSLPRREQLLLSLLQTQPVVKLSMSQRHIQDTGIAGHADCPSQGLPSTALTPGTPVKHRHGQQRSLPSLKLAEKQATHWRGHTAPHCFTNIFLDPLGNSTGPLSTWHPWALLHISQVLCLPVGLAWSSLQTCNTYILVPHLKHIYKPPWVYQHGCTTCLMSQPRPLLLTSWSCLIFASKYACTHYAQQVWGRYRRSVPPVAVF